MNNIQPSKFAQIKNLIYSIRGKQVMLDSDLAEIYGVETKNLNRAVKRNIERFPNKFRFQLTQIEFDKYEQSLRCRNITLKNNQNNIRSQIATLKPGNLE